MTIKRINKSQIGGSLTIESKQIFMNDRKKNAVKSAKTIPHSIVRMRVELY
jgi:hypothetical protein